MVGRSEIKREYDADESMIIMLHVEEARKPGSNESQRELKMPPRKRKKRPNQPPKLDIIERNAVCPSWAVQDRSCRKPLRIDGMLRADEKGRVDQYHLELSESRALRGR